MHPETLPAAHLPHQPNCLQSAGWYCTSLSRIGGTMPHNQANRLLYSVLPVHPGQWLRSAPNLASLGFGFMKRQRNEEHVASNKVKFMFSCVFHAKAQRKYKRRKGHFLCAFASFAPLRETHTKPQTSVLSHPLTQPV